jgi:hypothetical protein
MEKQAVQILVHEYAMRLSTTNAPRIKIVLHKSSAGHEPFVRELLSASPETHLEVSIDPLIDADGGQYSILVSVVSKTIPPLLEQHIVKVLAGIPLETVCAILAMSYRYRPEVAEHFFQTCSAWIDIGGKVSVTVFNSREQFLGKCEIGTIGRFSWKEKLDELHPSHNPSMFN